MTGKLTMGYLPPLDPNRDSSFARQTILVFIVNTFYLLPGIGSDDTWVWLNRHNSQRAVTTVKNQTLSTGRTVLLLSV